MSSKSDNKFSPLSVQDSLASNYSVSSFGSPDANKVNRTVTLLDWDDTVMPSTYIMKTFCDHSKWGGYAAIKKQCVDKFLAQCDGKMFCNEHIQSQFAFNMESVGKAALDLLNKLIGHFGNENVKIVTNGARGWLATSLLIGAAVSESYREVQLLLSKANIQIVYARNEKIGTSVWKAIAYHTVLGRAKIDFSKKYVNIITIGDQWTDHSSLHQLTLFDVFRNNIFHHQIKFYDQANCEYLCMELKYIANIIETHIVANICDEGMILEFEG